MQSPQPSRTTQERSPLLPHLALSPAVIICDLKREIISWNAAAEQIFGYSSAEAIGHSINVIVPQELESETTQSLDSVAKGLEIPEHECTGLTKDGRRLLVGLSICPVRGSSRKISGSCTIARDLSAEKRAGTALRHSEEQYRILFQNNPLPMWVYDPETLGFVAVNAAAVERYGYTPQEFFRMTLRDVRPAEDVPAMERMSSRPLQTGTHHLGVWRHVKKDGTIIFVDVICRKLEIGRKATVLSLLLDVTEDHKREQRLRQSEDRFSKAFRSSPLAMTIVRPRDGRYIEVNDAFCRMIGSQPEDLIGKTTLETGLWVDTTEREMMINRLNKDRSCAMEVRFRTKSGAVAYVQLSADLIELDGEDCVLAISNDVSEAKRLEQQFRQAQKMESIGRLAGGIAHDFNNMLGVILGYSDILLDGLQEDKHREQVKEIKAAAARAASLTRQLLAFSRQQIMQPKVLDLNSVIADLSSMLRRMIGEDIQFSFNPDSKLGRVNADPGQIEQILMNLAVNARDAMPRGGQFVIATSNAELDEVYASEHPGAVPGQYVCISVSDTGIGIPPEVMPHIYEPFFTTKGPGEGTGLGLSTVYGAVKQSSGYIWAYSEMGQGTRFKIFLPRVQAPASLETPKPAATRAKTSATILLVEDDGALRKLTRGLLEEGGYRVLEAKDGAAALEFCEHRNTPIDLLLTDVVMPQMSGHDLATRVQQMYPGVRVLYISGYTNDLIATHGALHEDVALLEKPYTRASLLETVEAVLHRSSHH